MKNIFSGINKLHLITGLLLAVLLLSWTGFQQWSIKHPPQQIRVAFNPACDLRAGPCLTTLEDGTRISFSIEPRTIPISKKLKLEVTVSGTELDVDAVSVDINGVDMKMPPNIVDLGQTGNGRYGGEGALSFCTRSIMEWESVVQLDSDNKQIRVPFRFITSQEAY